MNHNLLFLTLRVFSLTGGIEKVSRVAGKAFYELCTERGFGVDIYSIYDSPADLDSKYFPAAVFTGFGGRKAPFVAGSIRRGRKASVVVLSHINLLGVGYTIKKLSPSTRIVLIAHGIEVWAELPAWKKAMLRACDQVLPVSSFTKDKMKDLYGIKEEGFRVINNCLDPFLPGLKDGGRSIELSKKYGLSAEDTVLLSLSRLSFKERYKGYDEVIMSLKAVKRTIPALKYLVIGKYDEAEKARLDRLISQQGLNAEVIFTGFIPDEELADHFSLADIYIMPSRKEGFGIVFIEALYYGKPVIAGNIDGSVDAVAGGELGLLVNPDRPTEIVAAVKKILANPEAFIPDQLEVLRRFSYPVYKEALRQAMRSLFPTHQLPSETGSRIIRQKATEGTESR